MKVVDRCLSQNATHVGVLTESPPAERYPRLYHFGEMNEHMARATPLAQFHHLPHAFRPDRKWGSRPDIPGTSQAPAPLRTRFGQYQTSSHECRLPEKWFFPMPAARGILWMTRLQGLAADSSPSIPQFAPAPTEPAHPVPCPHDRKTSSFPFWGDAMSDFETVKLRVVDPIGFLLDEEQEVTVSVDRPDGSPLPSPLPHPGARPSATRRRSPSPTMRPRPSSAGPRTGWPRVPTLARNRATVTTTTITTTTSTTATPATTWAAGIDFRSERPVSRKLKRGVT